MPRTNLAIVPALILATTVAFGLNSKIASEVDSIYPDAHALYLDLHQNPELSFHETQTAAKLADRLRKLGYDVTEHIGGTGIVAILRTAPAPRSCCAPNSTPSPSK